MEQNHSLYMVEGFYEEQFHGTILNLGQWFRRVCDFQNFLFSALVATSNFSAERTFCGILVDW